MEAFGHQADEIPEIVMRRRRLREGAIGLGLDRMDEVGKFDRVLDEEDGNIVADEIPIALLRVELDREAADIARQIEAALRTRDGREAHKGGGAFADALENIGAADVGEAVGELEDSRARHSRGHGRRARECVHDRNGRFFRENGNLPAASGRARPVSDCSGRRQPACPAGSSAPRRRLRRSGAFRPRSPMVRRNGS